MIFSLRLTNIRTFSDRRFEFKPGVNLVVGQNGSGKTTILESIALFALGKFQSIGQDFLAVKAGEEVGRLEVKTDVGEAEAAIYLGGKILKVKEKKIPNTKIVGFQKVVFFNPETIDLVSGSPQVRRRELDSAISQKKNRFIVDLLKYRKVLKQRNNLLKLISLNRAARSELEFWDRELSDLTGKIYKARMKLVEFVNADLAKTHFALLGRDGNLSLKYLPSVDYSCFEEAIIASRDDDLRYGQTGIGPHRDDFLFETTRHERKFSLRDGGSRGEQRLAAIALKEELKKFLTDEVEPILILDDVFSELDLKRREAISNLIKGGQVFISATDEKVIPEEILGRANIIRLG